VAPGTFCFLLSRDFATTAVAAGPAAQKAKVTTRAAAAKENRKAQVPVRCVDTGLTCSGVLQRKFRRS